MDLKRHRYIDGVIASSTASVVARVSTYPFDTMRVITQSSGISASSTSMSSWRSMAYSVGFHGLFAGLLPALMIGTPASVVYLTTYDMMKQKQLCIIPSNTFSSYIVAATAAEMLNGLLWTPMDIIKCRMQLHQRDSVSIIHSIWKAEGVLGFYRGYIAGLSVFLPHSITFFLVYESMKNRFLIEKGVGYGHVGAALTAGVAAGVAGNFPECIKTNIQVGDKRRSAMDLCHVVLQQNGMKGFMRGATLRVLWVAPSATITISVYEKMKEFLQL